MSIPTKDSIINNETIIQHDELLPDSYISIEKSPELQGQADLVGAKNAVLVIIISLILTDGKSVLLNVPDSEDVHQMMLLLQDLGAHVVFYPELNRLEVDTTHINGFKVRPEIMKKMRASVLVMGPYIIRFGRAEIALPGGDQIGERPIDFHLKNFERMGVEQEISSELLIVKTSQLQSQTLVLEYPSVGATENLLMAATLTPGITRIINAALEPEVIDLINILKAMGAHININAPAIIEIEGVQSLHPVEYSIMYDRLEAGSLLLAAAITGGSIYLPQADWDVLDVFLAKLQEMGHSVIRGPQGKGISLSASKSPRAVSFKTSPYPGFPTDLQPLMMAAQCVAQGKSIIHETVYENRFLHVRELQKMGANIRIEGDRAYIIGVEELYGTHVIASDIRASCSLVLAGLSAKGRTIMTGVSHWKRGYQALDQKLMKLGAKIFLKTS